MKYNGRWHKLIQAICAGIALGVLVMVSIYSTITGRYDVAFKYLMSLVFFISLYRVFIVLFVEKVEFVLEESTITHTTEDGGMAMILEVAHHKYFDKPIWVKIISYDETKNHEDFKKLLTQKAIRVTIEGTGEKEK